MKKVLAMLLAVMMVISLAACGGAASSAPAAEESAAAEEGGDSEKLTIFFTNAILTAPYCAVQLEAMQAYAEANNIDLQVADGKEDAQTQLDQIKNAVTQGVDGIVYFPGDQASTIPVVRYLAECGTPFIVLNSKVDESVQDLVPSYVGSDYEAMGKIAGELAVDALGEDGGNLVYIDGLSGTEVALATEKGFTEAISANGNINILAQQPADWDTAKAMSVMEDFITTFGDDIDCIFAVDGGMAKGAAQALENAGLWGKIPMVCSDQGQFVLDAIAAGEMSGTAMQDPYQEGELAMQVIVKLINGESVEKWEVLPTGKVTKENASSMHGY